MAREKEVIDPLEVEVDAEVREVASVFVSDGVFKYVYVDTGEDVV